ncbi:glutathione S-transferase family protein [Polaromonas sp.]|uniref:glutathione S-transferase family protein n=1 Tax=Polaromonas sp. TaxID=1869339 RepID=UPI003CB1836C
MLKLYIANKNYSSWSMRPWVLLKQAGIAFEEVMVRFGTDAFADDSTFKQGILAVNPSGRVPVLVDDGLAVWDTLAIAEYVAEKFPEKQLWPQDAKARARARSVCAEMHSGFGALRSACPMNIEAPLSQTGAIIWRDQPAVRKDVQRIVTMWTELLEQHGGSMRTAGPSQGASAPSGGRETKSSGGAQFLFGEFSIADAYFAPVCMRLKTYALPVPATITDYIDRVCALPGVKAWITDALAEKDFVTFDEPYRIAR